jgi:aspartate aminotransferase-like enzyme
MPTAGLARLRDIIRETEANGLEKVRDEQFDLGRRTRALPAVKGFSTVAATGFEAPGVVVYYTDDNGIWSGQKFAAAGLQIAVGVPLQCDDPENFKTFPIGPFGLDKLHNVSSTAASPKTALGVIL